MKTEGKFMFLIYELFLGLSRGEETLGFGKFYGSLHIIVPVAGMRVVFGARGVVRRGTSADKSRRLLVRQLV